MCDIVQELKTRYTMKDQHVPGRTPKIPLYKYGGWLIRTVTGIPKEMPNAWSFKAANIESQSFSTSFMHESIANNRIYSLSESPIGYIIFPPLKTPKGKVPAEVLCAFPYDGHTNFRRENRGCTSSTPIKFENQKEKSGFCHDQHVTDLKSWKKHSKTESANTFNPLYLMKCQCAVYMLDQKTAYDSFNLVLVANVYLLTIHANIHNEVLLTIWDMNNPNSMPIEAFFYIIGSVDGLNQIKKHQLEYYCATMYIIVPVVGIGPPTKTSGIVIQLVPTTLSESDCKTQLPAARERKSPPGKSRQLREPSPPTDLL